MEGTYAFLELVSSVQKQAGFYVQPAFLEIARPSVSEGAQYCLATGARRLLVIPFFLFEGQDVKKKLPQVLEEALKRSWEDPKSKDAPPPAVAVCGPIGADARIIEILKERFTAVQSPRLSSSTAVVLAARGFSDRDAMAEMEEVREQFAKDGAYPVVRHAFVEIASPSIPEGIKACLVSQPKSIVVLPYLLFPGRMLKKIKDQIAGLGSQETEGVPVLLGGCLAPHPKLTELLLERIGREI